ncbi:uncharacterized protein LOC120685857 isoform X2 [Panicum virgatum]|uniref:uncharacterized protein LOC120685857 isoform X2 n=1 Tax=Panicum virgatum TaxID=38727 RepID=UPI0019D57EDF|nr:uncharacterized protein LOC120685857 isoform X2 [Panicum virgatum]
MPSSTPPPGKHDPSTNLSSDPALRPFATTMGTNASTSNLTVTSPPYYSKDAFSISSGASHHLTGNMLLFDQGSLVQYNDTLKLSAMDYDVFFIKNGGCVVKERLGGEVVGEATLLNGLYMVDYLRIPLDRSCLPDYETVEAALGFL